MNLYWALDPILLTDNALSTEGRHESKNNFLLVYNCPSVIDIILVAIYSVISLAMVSIIGKAVIEPLKVLNFNFPPRSKIEAWIRPNRGNILIA